MPLPASRLPLLATILAAALGAAETPTPTPPPVPPAKPIPPALVQAITREVLRPNGDAEGLPLPLAARWTPHNLLDANTGKPAGTPGQWFISYPFTIDRVLDDIAAGHRVMPFLGWPHANMGPNYYFEETASFQRGFRRLAAAKLPFEIEAGNIEGAMLDDAVPAGKPADNPAFFDQNWQLTVTAPAAKDATTLMVKGCPPKAALAGGWLVFVSSGRPTTLATPLQADAEGNATLTLHQPFPEAIAVGEKLLRADARMDVWAQVPDKTWYDGGATIPIGGGSYALDDWKKLAAIYPDPPQIQIVSNNEGARVRIGESGNSWHAQRHQGVDHRDVFATSYVKAWKSYLRGMREALPWKPQTIKAIGYNAFGVNFEVGRWHGWSENMVPIGPVDCYEWLAWDGSAPDHYAYDWNYATDEHVGSPHIGAMQAYSMLSQRAMAQVPGYLWQLALWDGGPKKRYRYANDGTIPGLPVGTVAVAPANGATTLQLRGGKRDSLVLDLGDIITVSGHSQAKPAQCSATFDQLSVTVEDGSSAAVADLRFADVGAVALPGKLVREKDAWRLSGSGSQLHSGSFDAMAFAHRDAAGMQSITVRVNGFGTAAQPAVARPLAGGPALPETAAHVDRAALERQRELEQASPSDQAGLMLRNGTRRDAACLTLLRSRSGKISLFWRGEDDPTSNAWTGIMGEADGPAEGPVWLRFARDPGDPPRFRPWWSADGKIWKELLAADNRPWLGHRSDSEALVAGLMVSTWTGQLGTHSYTVAGPVRTDAAGTATIPIADTDFSDPIGANAMHPAIVVGAHIQRLDYLPRYAGFSTMALWLSRPRIIREFAWGDFDRQIEGQWAALMGVVDRVWSDPVLTRFWRKGKLVPSPTFGEQTKRHHPMSGIGEAWGKRWSGQDFFFQLPVAINAPFSAWPVDNAVTNTSRDQEGGVIKVWAIAYELGTKPKREWLLITQSPREDRKAVVVTVPGFGDATVDVPRSGSFHHLREGVKAPVRVGSP